MVITAVFDRVEDGVAVLLSKEYTLEFNIPADAIQQPVKKGDIIIVTLDESSNISAKK